jgi:N-hydroxyarylamine O-acetyltransferase
MARSPLKIWMCCCREIHLDDRTLEEKLIHGRRGGYCFEQNGLLERAARDRF